MGGQAKSLIAISLLGVATWQCSARQRSARAVPPRAAPAVVAPPAAPARAPRSPPPAPTGPATVLFAKTEGGLAPLACALGHKLERGAACLRYVGASRPLGVVENLEPLRVHSVPLPPLGDVHCYGAPPTRGIVWPKYSREIEPAFAVWPASKLSSLHRLRRQLFYEPQYLLDLSRKALNVPGAELRLIDARVANLDGTGELRTLASVSVKPPGSAEFGAILEVHQRAHPRYRQPHAELHLVWTTDLDGDGVNELIVSGVRVAGGGYAVAHSVSLLRLDHDALRPIARVACLNSVGAKKGFKL